LVTSRHKDKKREKSTSSNLWQARRGQNRLNNRTEAAHPRPPASALISPLDIRRTAGGHQSRPTAVPRAGTRGNRHVPPRQLPLRDFTPCPHLRVTPPRRCRSYPSSENGQAGPGPPSPVCPWPRHCPRRMTVKTNPFQEARGLRREQLPGVKALWPEIAEEPPCGQSPPTKGRSARERRATSPPGPERVDRPCTRTCGKSSRPPSTHRGRELQAALGAGRGGYASGFGPGPVAGRLGPANRAPPTWWRTLSAPESAFRAVQADPAMALPRTPDSSGLDPIGRPRA